MDNNGLTVEGYLLAKVTELSVVNAELLAALESLLSFDCIIWACDKGPDGEGWKSDELSSAFSAAESAIAKARRQE